MSEPTAYTLGVWRVKDGKEHEFIQAWQDIAAVFLKLERPPLWGKLLQSNAEPNQFYSFGPWDSPDDVAAMREDPVAQAAIQRAAALCEHAAPTPCTLRASVAAP